MQRLAMPRALWARQETPRLPDLQHQQDHRESKHAGNFQLTLKECTYTCTHAYILTLPFNEKGLDFPMFSPLTNPDGSKGCRTEEKVTASCAKTASVGLGRWLAQ